MSPSPPSPSRRLAAWGALLSLLLPGLGQALARRFRAGAGFAVASVALSIVMVALARAAPPLRIPPAELAAVIALTLLTLGLNLAAAGHAWVVLRRPLRPRPPGRRYSPWIWAIVLLALTAAGDLAAPDLGWSGFVVPSASMHPTLLEGDRFLAVGGPALATALEPGDVIVFRLPRDPSIHYVKRLIAGPGQSAQMREGRLIIDGAEVPREDLGEVSPGLHRWRMTLPDGRSYVALKHPDRPYPLDNTPLFTLGADQLFVMGDNIDDSLDSRAPGQSSEGGVGLLARELVEGRVSVIFWSRTPGRIGRTVP